MDGSSHHRLQASLLLRIGSVPLDQKDRAEWGGEDILQSLAFEAANYNPYAFILVRRAGALPMVTLRG